MDEQKITAGLLENLMSGISEECWCAGWMHNLEYMLWDAVVGRREGICKPEEIEQLKYLSGKCGCRYIIFRAVIHLKSRPWQRKSVAQWQRHI